MAGTSPFWTSFALWSEAASLAFWLVTRAHPDNRATALLLAGMPLTILTLRVQTTATVPGKRRLYGLTLRLHRCLVAYAFPAPDLATACTALPPGVRLLWLLAAKTGLTHVAVVSLALLDSAGWLVAQQAVSALLLAKRAPAVCAAVAAVTPRPTALWRLLTPAAAQLERLLVVWGLLSRTATPPGLQSHCQLVVMSLIFLCVLLAPLCVSLASWLRRSPAPPAAASALPQPAAVAADRQPRRAGGSPRRRRRWGGRRRGGR